MQHLLGYPSRMPGPYEVLEYRHMVMHVLAFSASLPHAQSAAHSSDQGVTVSVTLDGPLDDPPNEHEGLGFVSKFMVQPGVTVPYWS